MIENLEEYFKMAFRNLRRRKLRAWLTMLGIIISVMIIFVLFSLSIGLQSAVQEQFREFGTDKIFIQPRGQLAPGTGGAVELTEEDVDVVKKISGIRDYTYWTVGSAKVEFRDEVRYFLIGGYPLDKAEVFFESGFYKAQSGELMREGDEGKIMIGSQYYENNIFDKPIEAGDVLTINDRDFKVRTVLETVGNPQDDRFIFMDINDFREIVPDAGDRLDFLVFQIEEGEDVNDIAEKAAKKLRNSRGVDEGEEDFTILTPEEALEAFGNILNILTGFLLGVAFISLLVGAIGVANTMYTSVLERTKEIGVMKAVGARNSDISLLFTIESGLLGLVGGVIGVVLGIGFAKLIEYIAVVQLATSILQTATPTILIVGCLLFSFVVGAVSGAWPAWKAAGVHPVEALRYE